MEHMSALCVDSWTGGEGAIDVLGPSGQRKTLMSCFWGPETESHLISTQRQRWTTGPKSPKARAQQGTWEKSHRTRTLELFRRQNISLFTEFPRHASF